VKGTALNGGPHAYRDVKWAMEINWELSHEMGERGGKNNGRGCWVFLWRMSSGASQSTPYVFKRQRDSWRAVTEFRIKSGHFVKMGQ